MLIRDAIRSDVPAILHIYNYAVRETTATFDLEDQTLAEREAWFDKYGGNFPLIVAELEGQVAGYASLSMFRAKPAYDRTVELSVYIDPDFWGRGLAKALMSDILGRARELGHHVVVSCITSGNDVSIKMHEKFDFEFVGTFKEVGYKFDSWQDVHFYQLILP